MKRKIYNLIFLISLVPFSVLAQELFSGELTEDLFFSNGLTLENIDQPDKSDVTSITTAQLSGVGSVTFGRASDGEFPRASLAAGTKITSTRDYTGIQEANREPWDGTLFPPSKARTIGLEDITDIGDLPEGTDPVVTGTYLWGESNERFTFSIPARVALEVDSADDGDLILFAELGDDGSWSIVSDKTCEVEDGLCVFDVGSVKGIALINLDGVGSGTSSSTASGGTGRVEDYGSFYQSAAKEWKANVPKKERRVTKVQYLGTNTPERNQMLSEEGLTGEDLAKVRRLNAGKLSRRIHNESEVAMEKKEHNSQELDYALSMRNQYVTSEHSKTFEQAELAEEEAENTHSQAFAARLPSSGPGLFMGIALFGFILMILGALRRD